MPVWLTNAGEVAIGLVGLMIGGDFLVRGASALARSLGVSAMVVALTIVAAGTSAPELVVSVYAAWQGVGDVTVGNAVGSNLFNVLLIIGLVATIQPITPHADFVRRECPIMIAAMAIGWLLCLTGELSREYAAILLALMVGYLWLTVKIAKRERSAEAKFEAAEFVDIDRARGMPIPIAIVIMVLGLALLVGGSHFFLEGSVAVARAWGVSELVIGLTLVAAGTSAPELVTSLVAVARGEGDIAVGNVVGSSIFNVLGILGAAGALSPLAISHEILVRDMPIMLVSGIAMWGFLATGATIRRWEGAMLAMAYVAYVAYLIIDGAA